jgi:hypothetical protein
MAHPGTARHTTVDRARAEADLERLSAMDEAMLAGHQPPQPQFPLVSIPLSGAHPNIKHRTPGPLCGSGHTPPS